MIKSHTTGQFWLYLAVVGFGLVNVALFLHPMNPSDFLVLAVSDPWSSIVDQQGGGVALFFWFSSALFAIGFAGLLSRLLNSHRIIAEMRSRTRPLMH